mmetsp:Transcript_32068/g.78696  ORF Transcript_32068/g.78696 Transcript_32068/m.78696 type:complete len:208 (-) Transcript_32068:997-1620(-)
MDGRNRTHTVLARGATQGRQGGGGGVEGARAGVERGVLGVALVVGVDMLPVLVEGLVDLLGVHARASVCDREKEEWVVVLVRPRRAVHRQRDATLVAELERVLEHVHDGAAEVRRVALDHLGERAHFELLSRLVEEHARVVAHREVVVHLLVVLVHRLHLGNDAVDELMEVENLLLELGHLARVKDDSVGRIVHEARQPARLRLEVV